MKTKLTATECALVEHRTSVLADGSWREIVLDSDSLAHLIPTCEADAIAVDAMARKSDLDLSALTQGQLEVVADCCDGSTFFCGSEDAVALGEVTRGWLMSRQKAAYSLQEKISAALNRPVRFVM